MTYVYTCSTMMVLCGGTQIWYCTGLELDLFYR